MKVTQDEIVDRQAVLNIELDPTSLEDHLQKAYKRLVGRVAVPGFRKGKAPRRIFEQTFGHERLVEEALETMVPDAVSEAIDENSIQAAGTPRVSVLEREPNPKIRATVPLAPVVTLGDYKSLHFDDVPEEVTDDRIDSVVERVRESQATWEPSETPVTVGDMAVISAVEGHAGGKEILKATDIEYEVQQDSTRPVPGFATELTGLEAGESKTFELLLPDDYPDPDVAGETAAFTVTISEVKRKRLPELDDDFAKGVGEGYESLDDLRAKIRTDLEQAAHQQHRRDLQDKILDAAVEQATVEIAPLTVEHEAEHVLTEQQEALSRYRMSLNDYMARVGMSAEQLVGEANESARKRLERSLVLEQLAEAEGVEVTREEIDERVKEFKEAATDPQERASYESDRARTSIESLIRREKTLDRLIELTTGVAQSEDAGPKEDDDATEVEASTPEAADAQSAAEPREPESAPQSAKE